VVVSDDCYDEMWLDTPVECTARVAADAAARGVEMPPVVSVFSFSKTHAMTGFRLGYVVCPPELTPRVHRVQETVLSCPSTPVQHAGLAAVTGPQEHVARMRNAYRERRDAAVTQLAGSHGGVAVETPAEGAFYLWLRQSSGRPSAELAEELLLEHRVALAPGTAFGPAGEGHLRVSLAASTETVLEGLRRVVEVVR
jgi:aspartate/methionine/tyrosine aminotransferase